MIQASSLPLKSPAAIAVLGIVGVGLLWVLGRELRKIPSKLGVLMATAFIDMVGLLMVIPLLPFYAKSLGGDQGIDLHLGIVTYHVGIGQVVALLVSAFTVAQLVSAPLWGRFSDRFGRRPALCVALAASAVAYVIFAFASNLWLLFLSRLVQGAGGGTVGVIQAYVADATEPQDRARSLGWLSAATNLGVSIGPVLGAAAVVAGNRVHLGSGVDMGERAPGLFAALLCLVNLAFAWRFLREARQPGVEAHAKAPKRSGEAIWRVVSHSAEPSSRLIWMYAISIGAFQGVNSILALYLAARFGVTKETIGFFFTYIGAISVFTRVLLLGRAVDSLGEARLSRAGMAFLALGLALLPLAGSLPMLALAVAFLPLGAAFTFPCVTALLSRVIQSNERGLYMGVQQTFGGISRSLFPLFFGLVYDRLGHGYPFWFSALIVFTTIFLGLGLDAHAKPAPKRAAEAA